MRSTFKVICALVIILASPWSTHAVSGFHVSTMDAGKPAPAFRLPTLEGNLIDSHTLSGQVILLNFWATWCGPCKEEMPSLEHLRRQLNSDRFKVFAVTADRSHKDIAQFWKSLDLHFKVLLDQQEDLSQALMVRNLPTTIIIDSEGTFVGRVMGPRDWSSPDTVKFFQTLLNHP